MDLDDPKLPEQLEEMFDIVLFVGSAMLLGFFLAVYLRPFLSTPVV